MKTATEETVPSEAEETFDNQFTVYMKIVASSVDPANTPPFYKLFVTMEDKEVPMKIDTGSSVTLLNSSIFFKMRNQIDTPQPSTVIRKALLGTLSIVFGEKEMISKTGNQVGKLLISVVKGPSLLGCDIMSKFTLPW